MRADIQAFPRRAMEFLLFRQVLKVTRQPISMYITETRRSQLGVFLDMPFRSSKLGASLRLNIAGIGDLGVSPTHETSPCFGDAGSTRPG